MCGESRTHSLEGVVEGRPSTTTLQRRVWVFVMIHLCDKMPDALSTRLYRQSHSGELSLPFSFQSAHFSQARCHKLNNNFIHTTPST